MSPRLAFAVDAAYRAGRLTLAAFGARAEFELKADASPVTRADREAEAFLRRELAAAYPGEPILGEEQGGAAEAETRWVIDPIDGTKSFVAGVPLYATLLSYEIEGEPVLGVCCLPALDEVLYAERGGGAFWNGRPARVSARAGLDGAVLACGGLASMRAHARLDPFLRLADRALVARSWSDAFGHCLVATGRADAMVDPVVAPWDVSAMAVIVAEAGGRTTAFDGVSAPGSEALSSNGRLHAALVEAFRA